MIRRLMFGGALCAVLHGAANAAIPVTDAQLLAQQTKSWALQLSAEAEQLSRWAEQINNMVQLVTLQNVAGLVLGEGMGGEFSRLASSVQGLYQNTSSLISNAQMKSFRLQQEMNQLLLPGRIDSMTPQQIFATVQRYRDFFGQDTLEARAIQAEGIALQDKLMRESLNGTRQADRSRSALSATQGLTHVAMAISSQLQTTNYTLGSMATTLTNEAMDRSVQRNVNETLSRNNSEQMAKYIASQALATKISPVRWGQP